MGGFDWKYPCTMFSGWYCDVCYRNFGRKIRMPSNTPFKSCDPCGWDVCIPCWEKSMATKKPEVQAPARNVTHTPYVPPPTYTQRPTYNTPMAQAPQLPTRAPIPNLSESTSASFILGVVLMILLVCAMCATCLCGIAIFLSKSRRGNRDRSFRDRYSLNQAELRA